MPLKNEGYFKDARILYIDHSANYYTLKIKESMENQGAKVDFISLEKETFLLKILKLLVIHYGLKVNINI